jgi:hypothetical protein
VKSDIHEAIMERFIEQLKRATLRAPRPGRRRGFDPNAMEARHQADRPTLPATSATLFITIVQKGRHTLAHPRLDRAHLHPSLRQGGRRILTAPAFGMAANQPTFKDDPRPSRPIERAVLSASVPSQLGGFTVKRAAFSPAPWQNLPETR